MGPGQALRAFRDDIVCVTSGMTFLSKMPTYTSRDGCYKGLSTTRGVIMEFMATNQDIKSIEEAALSLDTEARVQLAHKLVESLSGLSRDELNALWLEESERRDAEMESGKVKGIPGDEVLARIESRYGK